MLRRWWTRLRLDCENDLKKSLLSKIFPPADSDPKRDITTQKLDHTSLTNSLK